MRWFIFSFLLFTFAGANSSVWAQFDPELSGKGPRLGEPFTQRYQVGVKINAGGGPCRGLVATIPIPQDWPEQQVKVDAEEVSKSVRSVRQSIVGGSVKQLAVSVPNLPAGQIATMLITYEITRYTLLPPENTTIFEIPKKLALAQRRYLGHSPLIESRHSEIRSKAKEILADHAEANAWEQVEVLYTWCKENITEQRGKLKGGLQTLRDGNGNDEDITSLFIALCRASGVPARTVWIPDGSYAEFMLADDEGENHWIPCRLTETPEFGQSKCEFPVLQKGDNFKVSHRREPVRYVPEYMKGTGGRPRVDFIRMPMPR